MERTFTLSLTHSLIHSLTFHSHTQSGEHAHSIFTHGFEGTLTPTLFHTQIGGHAHSLPLSHLLTHLLSLSYSLSLSHSLTRSRGQTHLLTSGFHTEGVEGTLTHSLTDPPLERVGGQSGDHTHSNSLSHTDWRARSLTPSHSLTLSLTLSLTHSLTFDSQLKKKVPHRLTLTLTHSLTNIFAFTLYILSLSHALTHSSGQTHSTH